MKDQRGTDECLGHYDYRTDAQKKRAEAVKSGACKCPRARTAEPGSTLHSRIGSFFSNRLEAEDPVDVEDPLFPPHQAQGLQSQEGTPGVFHLAQAKGLTVLRLLTSEPFR